MRFRPTRSVAVIVALILAFLIASRTTGSGWLTIMVSMLAATLVWSFVRPAWLLRRVTLTMETPPDGMVGRSLPVEIQTFGPSCELRLTILNFDTKPIRSACPQQGKTKVYPATRGVVQTLEVLVETASGLGLAWARRTVILPLARPLEVAPRPTPVSLPQSATTSGEGESAVGGRHNDGETVRAVREYRLGDPVRMIHWGVTARRGQLVVKELESPQSPSLTVSLDLRGLSAEQNASLAAGYVAAGLRSGLPVILHTMERSGPHRGGVGSNLEAGRRLARAVAERLPDIPASGPTVHLGPKGF